MRREKRVRIIEVKHARALSRKLRALAGRARPRVDWFGRDVIDAFERGAARSFREAARMIDALPRVRKRMGRVSV